MITNLMDGLPNQSMAQVPFDEAVAKYMTELPLRGAEENALLADVKAKQVLVNESAASAEASVNAATAQAVAAQAARDAAVVARIAAQAAASDAHEAATGTVLTGTSTTPLVIGTGNKTLATQASKQYATNIFITAVSASDPTRFMTGTVASYVGTTLTIAVTAVGGNGDTKSDWNISVTGAPGAAASAALKGNATGAIELLKGTAPAASATPDIWAAGGNRVPISSGITITGFPAAPQAGAQRTLVATVAFSITNGANLVIAGGSTAVAVGDEVDVTAETPTLFKAWVRRVTSASGATTGDTLTTARALTAPDWLRCDGSDYLASSYPGLAGLLGPASIFSKLPDPAVMPPGVGRSVAYSADGVYLAVSHDVTPFISVYKLTAGVYVKLAALTAATGGTPLWVTFSPDGRYLFVLSTSDPYGHLYERTGDTFAKLALPSGLPGSVIGSTSAAFSPDGTMLALPDFRGTGKVFIHNTFGNWTVATTVASLYAEGVAQSVAFSPDGTHLMASFSATTPFLQGWERSGNTFPNRLTISSQPANYATYMAYSSDSKYLALSLTTYPSGFGSPGYSVHSRVGNSYTKLAVPQINPDANGCGVSFSPDTRQLAVLRQTAPYLTVLRRNGDQFTARTDMPGIPITGVIGRQAVAFSPTSNDLALTTQTTPFMYVLRDTVDPTKTRVPNLPTDDSLVNTYIKT